MPSGPPASRPARRAARPRRGRRPGRFLALAVVAALLVAAVIAEVGADAEPTIPKNAVRVDVSSTAVSRPVAPGFVGLSIEYRSAGYYFGSGPGALNPLFRSLVRQLTPGQSPVIRFGGDTTDWTWWTTPGVARPPGVKFTLGPAWVQTTRAAAQALRARLILGINFESDSGYIAGTEADHLLDGLGAGQIAGFELGNEPEVYGTIGWYANAQGVGVPGRAPNYGFGAYLRDYAGVSSSLPRTVPLIGPASGAPVWLRGVSRYLKANPRVRMVTFHRYPLNRCFTSRTSPKYPTIANLLAPRASSGLADSLRSAVRAAHARGAAFRADELNSVACGGARGVSDTFASALWVLDTLFGMARVGVDGVNVHTFRNAIYAPFAFGDAGGRWTAQVKPMYYGLLLFARAAPPGARIMATTTAPPAAAGPGSTRIAPSDLRTWATRTPDGRVRVVLINDSLHQWVTTAVRAAPRAGTATAERLRAPGLAARSGITLGGQSFGSRTTTARLTGPLRRQALTAVQGRFVVRLPPGSATLLTVGG